MEKELRDLPHDFHLLVSADSGVRLLEGYKILEQFPFYGVCVSLNKPVHSILRYLKKNNVHHNKIKFIDGVSIPIRSTIRHENVTYVADASNFSELGLEIERQVQKIHGKKFLLFDGVHDLFLLNGKLALDFVKFLEKRMKVYHANCIFLLRNKIVDEKIRSELLKLCDKEVVLG